MTDAINKTLTDGEQMALESLVDGVARPFRALHIQARNLATLAGLRDRELVYSLMLEGELHWRITEAGKALIAPLLAADADLFLKSLGARDQDALRLEAQLAAARLIETEIAALLRQHGVAPGSTLSMVRALVEREKMTRIALLATTEMISEYRHQRIMEVNGEEPNYPSNGDTYNLIVANRDLLNAKDKPPALRLEA